MCVCCCLRLAGCVIELRWVVSLRCRFSSFPKGFRMFQRLHGALKYYPSRFRNSGCPIAHIENPDSTYIGNCWIGDVMHGIRSFFQERAAAEQRSRLKCRLLARSRGLHMATACTMDVLVTSFGIV